MFGADLYQQFNTVTDWNAVRNAGVSFAYIKLTDGGGQAIVHGDAYVAGARGAGIRVGGYHYMEATPSPETQADVFAAELQRLNALDIVPALDIEEPSIPVASRVDFGQRFLRRLQANLGGARVGIYSSSSWFTALSPDTWGIPGLVDWDAEYGINDGTEHPISGYSGHVDVHQYTSVGHVAGISGNVDMDDAFNNISETPMDQEDAMIIECDQLGIQAILSGGIVTGLDAQSESAISTTLFPRTYVTSVVFNDLQAKSTALQALGPKLDAVTTAIQALPAAIAAAIPAASGGLTAAQFTSAVQAGVSAALAGETITFK